MRKAKCGITIKLPEVVAHFPHKMLQKENHIYKAVNQLISCTLMLAVHSANKYHLNTAVLLWCPVKRVESQFTDG